MVVAARQFRFVAASLFVVCCLLLVGVISCAAPAFAGMAQLSVADLGQPAELSAAPQPPLVLDPSGACSSPFTIESACPAGSWPALGSEWGPTLYVAGGDTIELAFHESMTSVQVASTTDAAAASGPPGTGQNENIIPISDARQASSETWLFTLPTLDPRAGSGFTFSVVGEAHGVSEDYPLTIRTPRSSNPGAACAAPFFFNPGEVADTCVSAVPPGHPSPPGTDGSGSPGSTAPGRGGGTTSPGEDVLGPPRIGSFRLLGRPRMTRRGLQLDFAVPNAGRLQIKLRAHSGALIVVSRKISDHTSHFTMLLSMPRRDSRGSAHLSATLRSPRHRPLTLTALVSTS
jgi:hypothetical protein